MKKMFDFQVTRDVYLMGHDAGHDKSVNHSYLINYQVFEN